MILKAPSKIRINKVNVVTIGAKEANEIAVMIDTFRPLQMTTYCSEIDDSDYPLSWLDSE